MLCYTNPSLLYVSSLYLFTVSIFYGPNYVSWNWICTMFHYWFISRWYSVNHSVYKMSITMSNAFYNLPKPKTSLNKICLKSILYFIWSANQSFNSIKFNLVYLYSAKQKKITSRHFICGTNMFCLDLQQDPTFDRHDFEK